MKRHDKLAIGIALIAISLILLITEIAHAGQDKLLHLGFSTMAGVGAGVVTVNIDDPTTRRVTAMGLCLVPGTVKELTDEVFDPVDMVANVAGCGIGLMVFEGIELYITEDSVLVAGRW